MSKRVNILGVGVSAINLPEATEFLLTHAEQGTLGYVNVCTVHSIIEAQDDPELRRAMNRSLLTTPDGMPLSWLGWHHGHNTMNRVYGPDLMLEIMKSTRDGRFSHFFLGGNVGVAQDLRAAMETRFPGVRIRGTYTPPFRPLNSKEESELFQTLEELRPDFIWVGLSTPKQDRFMARYRERISHGILLGVGAAFDFHTGNVRQAPAWMQRCGLEWFFRLTQEPKRLWKRYLSTNPRFVYLTLLQLTKLRKFSVADENNQ